MDESKWVKILVEAFGPVAAAFALMAGVLLYLLIRNLKDEKNVLMSLVRENITANSSMSLNLRELSRTIEKLADTNEHSAEAYTKQIDNIVRVWERRFP